MLLFLTINMAGVTSRVNHHISLLPNSLKNKLNFLLLTEQYGRYFRYIHFTVLRRVQVLSTFSVLSGVLLRSIEGTICR